MMTSSTRARAWDVDDDKPHIETDSLSFICYNMLGTHADTDRWMIQSLLLSESPDVIILQEPRWAESTFTNKKYCNATDTYQYVANGKQVGIMYQHQILKLVQKISLPPIDKRFNSLVQSNTICAQFKHQLYNYEFFVVSYHGPDHTGSYTLNEKMEAINAIFSVIVKIAHTFNPPLPIIGGTDTNLDLSRALEGKLEKLSTPLELPTHFILHDDYKSTDRRKVPEVLPVGRPPLGKIDYFFHYPSTLQFHMTSVMDVEQHSSLVRTFFPKNHIQEDKISNHDPLMATMTTTNIQTCFQQLLIANPIDIEYDENDFSDDEDAHEDAEYDFNEEDDDEDELDDNYQYDSDDNSGNIDSDSDSDSNSDTDEEYTYYKDGRILDSDGVDSDGEDHSG